jgi:hypothetical protein
MYALELYSLYITSIIILSSFIKNAKTLASSARFLIIYFIMVADVIII